MRRVGFLVLFLGLAVAPLGYAQERPKPAPSSENGEGGLKVWEWVNFLILAAGLGYLAGKNGGPFFAARSKQIHQEISEASELKKQAEARAAELERRLAGMEAYVASLREDAQNEARARGERIAREAAIEASKIQAQAEQDIAAAAKAARAQLQRHAADVAVDLAGQLIRARMTKDVQDELVLEFVRNLDRPAEPGTTKN